MTPKQDDLRDQFAANALQGLLAGHRPFFGDLNKPGAKDRYCREAYAIADTMLRVRKEQSEKPER